MAQQELQCLCSSRTQVQSPAWHSGLKDPALQQLWHRSPLWLRFDLWPGNSICCRVAKRKKKKKKKKERKKTMTNSNLSIDFYNKLNKYCDNPYFKGWKLKPI